MSISKITCLSIDLHSHVFDFLDPLSQVAYTQLSQDMHALQEQLVKFGPWAAKVEKGILEHYDILGCYPSRGNLKKFLFTDPEDPYLIAFAETHNLESHVFLNSGICNALCCSEEMSILIEGGASSLQYWKKERSYLFKYFKPEIIDRVKTWDLDASKNEEGSGIIENEIVYARNMIEKCQKLFTLYSDKKKWSVDHFCDFFKDTFQEKGAASFWSSIFNNFPSFDADIFPTRKFFVIETFKFIEKFSKLGKKFVMESLKIQALRFIKKTVIPADFVNACRKIHYKRDKRLQDLSLDIITKQKRDCFVIAGASHVKKMYNFYKSLLPRDVRYLFLIPKERIHIGKIKENFNRIFYETETGASDEGLEELEQPLDYDQQVKRLLRLNVKDLDHDRNHYGLWEQRIHELHVLVSKKSIAKIHKISMSLFPLLKNDLLARAVRAILSEFLASCEITLITEYTVPTESFS